MSAESCQYGVSSCAFGKTVFRSHLLSWDPSQSATCRTGIAQRGQRHHSLSGNRPRPFCAPLFSGRKLPDDAAGLVSVGGMPGGMPGAFDMSGLQGLLNVRGLYSWPRCFATFRVKRSY